MTEDAMHNVVDIMGIDTLDEIIRDVMAAVFVHEEDLAISAVDILTGVRQAFLKHGIEG